MQRNTNVNKAHRICNYLIFRQPFHHSDSQRRKGTTITCKHRASSRLQSERVHQETTNKIMCWRAIYGIFLESLFFNFPQELDCWQHLDLHPVKQPESPSRYSKQNLYLKEPSWHFPKVSVLQLPRRAWLLTTLLTNKLREQLSILQTYGNLIRNNNGSRCLSLAKILEKLPGVENLTSSLVLNTP